jgi:hypothetical protein
LAETNITKVLMTKVTEAATPEVWSEFRLRQKKVPSPANAGGNGTLEGLCLGRSEIELPGELEDSRIKGRSHLAEVAGAKPIADGIELGVVPDVEALGAELEPSGTILAEREAFE